MKNKKFLINVLTVAVPASVSALTAWFVSDRVTRSEVEEVFEKEFESTRLVIQNLYSKISDLEERVQTPKNDDTENPENDDDDAESNVVRVFPHNDRIDLEELVRSANIVEYNKIVSRSQYADSDEEEKPKFDAGLVGEPSWNPDSEDVSVISKDIFDKNASEFTRVTLTYFQDGAVVDEVGDLVSDHESLIGSGKPPFGQMSDDPQIVYIRNKAEKTEFEIVQDPGKATDFLMHGLHNMYNSHGQT